MKIRVATENDLGEYISGIGNPIEFDKIKNEMWFEVNPKV